MEEGPPTEMVEWRRKRTGRLHLQSTLLPEISAYRRIPRLAMSVL